MQESSQLRTRSTDEANGRNRAPRLLVIAGFSSQKHGEAKPGKLRSHLGPLLRVTSGMTYVSPDDGISSFDEIEFRPSDRSSRLAQLLEQAIDVIRLARSGDYDAIISFSLVPYGLLALLGKAVSGRPAHLGIIGMDLDVHANAIYGPFVRWAFRQFDAITVAGSAYRSRLIDMGVSPARISCVSHPVDDPFIDASQSADPAYDLLWLGRMSPEKDPLRFVSIVARLHERGYPCRAAMVGDGPLLGAVREEATRAGVGDVIDTPGWEADPLPWYRNARFYVSTSEREMLPLTVIEAMAVGVPPVVPRLGALPDLVRDGDNGILVADRGVDTYADRIEEYLQEELDSTLSTEAARTGAQLSVDRVAADWVPVLERLIE